MAIKVPLSPTVSDQIPLKKSDESGESWVQYQQPTGGDEESIEHLQMGDLIFEEDGGQRIINRKGMSHAVKLQVAYCLVGSNLVTEKGAQLFRPGVTCREQGRPLSSDVMAEFELIWDAMPKGLKEEMVELLYEFYPPFQGT